VEFFTHHRVECDGGSIKVDGNHVEKPLLLQADGSLAA
jgi:hypothetical protein